MSDVRPISYAVIAHMVCKRMTDLGWSVKDLAAYCHISAATLGHIRSGDIRVSFRLFSKILEILGIHLEYGPALTAKQVIGRKIGERRKGQYKAVMSDGRKAWVSRGFVVAHLPQKTPKDCAS